MATAKNITEIPDSILIESLMYRMKQELTELLMERVARPLIEEAAEKAAQEVTAAVSKNLAPHEWHSELRYVLQWRDKR